MIPGLAATKPARDVAHNERVKLTANTLNNVCSGLVITGVVAPIVALIYGVPGPAQVPAGLAVLSTLFCLSGGLALHLFARAVLKDLRG